MEAIHLDRYGYITMVSISIDIQCKVEKQEQISAYSYHNYQ
ncbi:MAG: hypothetical protein MAG581_00253 [Deltaproteobacteria bacterium]|jgi:hypothetical protein|nr:hypothetical protein [Deltaproteobacteria bacterium]